MSNFRTLIDSDLLRHYMRAVGFEAVAQQTYGNGSSGLTSFVRGKETIYGHGNADPTFEDIAQAMRLPVSELCARIGVCRTADKLIREANGIEAVVERRTAVSEHLRQEGHIALYDAGISPDEWEKARRT